MVLYQRTLTPVMFMTWLLILLTELPFTVTTEDRAQKSWPFPDHKNDIQAPVPEQSEHRQLGDNKIVSDVTPAIGVDATPSAFFNAGSKGLGERDIGDGTKSNVGEKKKKKNKKNKKNKSKSKSKDEKRPGFDLSDFPRLSAFLKDNNTPNKNANTNTNITQESKKEIDYAYDDSDSYSDHDYFGIDYDYPDNQNLSDYEHDLDLEDTQAWGSNVAMPDGFQTLQGQRQPDIYFDTHGLHGASSSMRAPNIAIGCPDKCECSGTMVDCSAQHLTSVPKGLSPLTIDLDLSLNKLERLPNVTFKHLTHLQDVHFVGNSLRRLPKNLFKYNTFLTHLNFQGNRFKKVPPRAFQNHKYLLELDLDANVIRSIPKNAFKGLTKLQQLPLDANQLDHIPTEALRELTGLRALSFAVNNITLIPNFAFQNNTRLIHLGFSSNKIGVIEDQAFYGLSDLKYLQLNRNRLHNMPTAFSHLTSLEELFLDDNYLTHLPDMSFQFKTKLSFLTLRNNPIKSIGHRAFSQLPALKNLILSEVHDLTRIPDLTGTHSLEVIQLDRANIESIPRDLCRLVPNLTRFDIHSNKIGTIPDMSRCTQLSNLNMANNEITSLEGQPFSGLKNLHDLTLSINYIHTVPMDAFTDLTSLEYLNLAENHISFIHPEAFLPLKSLTDLNLGANQLRNLPSAGLSNLQKLKVFHNTDLKEFPPKEAFPNVNNFVLAYAYHCCDFINTRPESLYTNQDVEGLSEDFVTFDSSMSVERLMETHFNASSQLMKSVENLTLDKDHDQLVETILYDSYATSWGEYSSYGGVEYENDLLMAKAAISCRPKPGPFMPCDDLFGWWSLRCGVWFVFLLALLGNGVVFLVSVTSRSKMDVPRFLICNLAMADFIMGVYLAILAIVDAVTLGQFKKSAIQWQMSPMCVTAGFLSVLSSELSVFTLTVITLERFYAITNAMQLNKRLSLKHAGIIMACGWFWCFGIATLPLFGISDYRKFAVCLPFEIEDVVSKSYVCFIMVFNGISFFIILGCYLVMYISIRNSQASNSNDTRVAKRMALLVFTDFLCWSPIAVLSLAAAFGKNFIHLNGAKVLTIFVLPLNSCANPFLYAIFTKQFKKDCVLLCRRLEDSSIARHFSQVSQRHVSISWKCQRRPSALHSLMGEGKSLNSHNHSTGSNSYGVINYNSELSTGKEMGTKDAGVKDNKNDLGANQPPRSIGANQCKSINSRSGKAGETCTGGSYSYKYSACPTKCEDDAEAEKMTSSRVMESANQRTAPNQDGAHIILHPDLCSQTDTNGCTSETYVNDDDDDVITSNFNNDISQAKITGHRQTSGEDDVTGQSYPEVWTMGNGQEKSEDQDVWQKMGPTGTEDKPMQGISKEQSSGRIGRPCTLADTYINNRQNVPPAGEITTRQELDNGGYYENDNPEYIKVASGNNQIAGGTDQKQNAHGNPKSSRHHRWRKNIKCCNANSSPIEKKEYDFASQQTKPSGHKKRSKDSRKNPCVEYVMYMPSDEGTQSTGIKYPNHRSDDEDDVVRRPVVEPMEKEIDNLPSRNTNRFPNEEEPTTKEVLISSSAPNPPVKGDKSLELEHTKTRLSSKLYPKSGKRHRLHRMHNKDACTLPNNHDVSVKSRAFPERKQNASSPPVSMLTQEILQHTTVDKSVHLRYFQQSMAGHNFVCKSNSLVELTESQLEEARTHQVPPNKRRSLTPEQEGYLVFGGETGECLVESFHHQHYSDYHPNPLSSINNCDDGGCNFPHPSAVEPLAHLNLNDYRGEITTGSYDERHPSLGYPSDVFDANDLEVKDNFRTTSKDWDQAEQEEIGVLLGTDSEDEQHCSLSNKNSADKESGFHSQISQV